MKGFRFLVDSLVSRFVAVLLIGAVVTPAAALALAPEQRKVFDLGIGYFNVEQDCSSSNGFSSKPSSGGSIYVLGDSLTVGMNSANLQTKLSTAGWQATKINGLEGRTLSQGSIEIFKDREIVKQSSAALLGLGTNNYLAAVESPAVVKSEMGDLVRKLRDEKADIKIYWTSFFLTGEAAAGSEALNKILREVAKERGVAIVPWDKSAEAKAEVEAGDGIHPRNYQVMADFVVGQLAQVGAESPKSSGNCVCSAEGGGDLIGSDNQERGFNYYVSKGYSKEQAAGIVGNMIHESGVEPMRLQGTGAGVETPSAKLGGNLNNSSIGWGIVQWTPPGKMINPSTASGVTNETIDTLEYQVEFVWKQLEGTSIDISEKAAGDHLKQQTTVDAAARSFMTKYERPADQSESAQADRAATAKEVFTVYANGSVGVNPPGGSCSNSGSLSPEGYAFPLAPQDRSVGGVEVGQTETAHHDNTPAFDLFSTDSADVYALYAGTAINVKTDYGNQAGCTSIQFRADDGFYYWYGHMKNPVVKEGQHVEAGAKLAQIADAAKFNSACFGGGPHLHIDRGCTVGGTPQPGGSDSCRDASFISFLAKLFETLPERR